jgi:hypothetical protein
MENEIDLKKMYAAADPAPPSGMDDLIKKANRLKNKKMIGTGMTNLLLVSTGIYISLLCTKDQPQFITTNIGIILIISAILIYVIVSNQFLPILFRVSNAQDNNKYMKDLLALKNKQRFFHSTIMNVSFALLTTGICLSMIESVSKLTSLWSICAYVLTVLWIGFNWFYIRPKTIKKQQGHLDEMIENIERVNQQLKEE